MGFLFNGIHDEEFFSSYYGKQIYLESDCKLLSKFSKLISDNPIMFLQRLNDKHIFNDFFVFRNGVGCSFDVYSNASRSRIHWDTIRTIYEEEGATIYLRGLQKYHSQIKLITRELESIIPNRRIFANFFLSPSNAVGLKPHFDPTDFLVLQILGEKQWKLWPPPLFEDAFKRTPEEAAKYSEQIASSCEPIASLTLRQGDSMYVPEFFVHAPFTVESRSCHITIGFADPTKRSPV